MKTTQKLKLVVNELITAAYQAWLARRAEAGAGAGPGPSDDLAAFFYFHRERMVRMNKANILIGRIKIGLAIAVLTALTGCIGWVGGGGGGDYGGGGWWGGDGGWWGGGRGYDRGREVRGYSARGAESRGVAHGGGGGGHSRAGEKR